MHRRLATAAGTGSLARCAAGLRRAITPRPCSQPGGRCRARLLVPHRPLVPVELHRRRFRPPHLVIGRGQHGDDGLVFTSSAGRPLRRSNFCRRVWHPALRAAGLPAIHFHDLRHTGNQFAADEGANLRELMDRMGHSTTRAALAYLHGSDERQQDIADALSSRAAAELNRPETRPSGTAAGEGVVSITGQPGHVGIELRFWLRAPGRTRTCDPLLRRSFPFIP